MAGGSDYVGDEFLFIGPLELPFYVPIGRICLNAFGREVYLGRTLLALVSAVKELETEISKGTLRPVGTPASERRGADAFFTGSVTVIVANQPADKDAELP